MPSSCPRSWAYARRLTKHWLTLPRIDGWLLSAAVAAISDITIVL